METGLGPSAQSAPASAHPAFADAPIYSNASEDASQRLVDVTHHAPTVSAKDPGLAYAISRINGDHQHAAAATESLSMLMNGHKQMMDLIGAGTHMSHLTQISNHIGMRSDSGVDNVNPVMMASIQGYHPNLLNTAGNIVGEYFSVLGGGIAHAAEGVGKTVEHAAEGLWNYLSPQPEMPVKGGFAPVRTGNPAVDKVLGNSPEQIAARERTAYDIYHSFSQLPTQIANNSKGPWWQWLVPINEAADIWDLTVGLGANLADSFMRQMPQAKDADPLGFFTSIAGSQDSPSGGVVQGFFSNWTLLSRMYSQLKATHGATVANLYFGAIVVGFVASQVGMRALAAAAPETAPADIGAAEAAMSGLEGLAGRGAASEAANAAAGEAGAAGAQAAAEGATASAEETTLGAQASKMADEAFLKRNPIYRALNLDHLKPLKTLLVTAFKIANKSVAAPGWLGAQAVGDAISMLMFPNEWAKVQKDSYVDPTTGQPVTFASNILSLGGNIHNEHAGWYNAASNVLNTLGYLVVPDPLAAAGRMTAAGKTAEGYAGGLGDIKGGTRLRGPGEVVGTSRVVSSADDIDRIASQYRGFRNFLNAVPHLSAGQIASMFPAEMPERLVQALGKAKTFDEAKNAFKKYADAFRLLGHEVPMLNSWRDFKSLKEDGASVNWRKKVVNVRDKLLIGEKIKTKTDQQMTRLLNLFRGDKATMSEAIRNEENRVWEQGPRLADDKGNKIVTDEQRAEAVNNIMRVARGVHPVSVVASNAMHAAVRAHSRLVDALFSGGRIERVWNNGITRISTHLAEMDTMFAQLPNGLDRSKQRFNTYSFPVAPSSISDVEKALRVAGASNETILYVVNALTENPWNHALWDNVLNNASAQIMQYRLELRLPGARYAAARAVIMKVLQNSDLDWWGHRKAGVLGEYATDAEGTRVGVHLPLSTSDEHPNAYENSSVPPTPKIGAPETVSTTNPSQTSMFHFASAVQMDRAVRVIAKQARYRIRDLEKAGLSNLLDAVTEMAVKYENKDIAGIVLDNQLHFVNMFTEAIDKILADAADSIRSDIGTERSGSSELTAEERSAAGTDAKSARRIARYNALSAKIRDFGTMLKSYDQVALEADAGISPGVLNDVALASLVTDIIRSSEDERYVKNLRDNMKYQSERGELTGTMAHPLHETHLSGMYDQSFPATSSIQQILDDLDRAKEHIAGHTEGLSDFHKTLNEAATNREGMLQDFQEIAAEHDAMIEAMSEVQTVGNDILTAGKQGNREARAARRAQRREEMPDGTRKPPRREYLDARGSFVDFVNRVWNDPYFKPMALGTGGWAFRVGLSETILNLFRIGPAHFAAGRLAASVAKNKDLLDQKARFVFPTRFSGEDVTINKANKWFGLKPDRLAGVMTTWPIVSAVRQTMMGMERVFLQIMDKEGMIDTAVRQMMLHGGQVINPSVGSAHAHSVMDMFDMRGPSYNTKHWGNDMAQDGIKKYTDTLLGPPVSVSEPVTFKASEEPEARLMSGGRGSKYNLENFQGPGDAKYPERLAMRLREVANDPFMSDIAKFIWDQFVTAGTSSVEHGPLLSQFAAENAHAAAQQALYDDIIGVYTPAADIVFINDVMKQLGPNATTFMRNNILVGARRDWKNRWSNLREKIEETHTPERYNAMVEEAAQFIRDRHETGVGLDTIAKNWAEMRAHSASHLYADWVRSQILEPISNPWLDNIPRWDEASQSFVARVHNVNDPITKSEDIKFDLDENGMRGIIDHLRSLGYHTGLPMGDNLLNELETRLTAVRKADYKEMRRLISDYYNTVAAWTAKGEYTMRPLANEAGLSAERVAQIRAEADTIFMTPNTPDGVEVARGNEALTPKHELAVQEVFRHKLIEIHSRLEREWERGYLSMTDPVQTANLGDVINKIVDASHVNRSEERRIIVSGSRDYPNREAVFKVLDDAASKTKHIVIIQGGARGADRYAREWAETYAKRHPDSDVFVEHIEVPAEWDKHGRSAGFRRNEKMAEEYGAQEVIAFSHHTPTSRGTQHMLDIAARHHLHTTLHGSETPEFGLSVEEEGKRATEELHGVSRSNFENYHNYRAELGLPKNEHGLYFDRDEEEMPYSAPDRPETFDGLAMALPQVYEEIRRSYIQQLFDEQAKERKSRYITSRIAEERARIEAGDAPTSDWIKNALNPLGNLDHVPSEAEAQQILRSIYWLDRPRATRGEATTFVTSGFKHGDPEIETAAQNSIKNNSINYASSVVRNTANEIGIDKLAKLHGVEFDRLERMLEDADREIDWYLSTHPDERADMDFVPVTAIEHLHHDAIFEEWAKDAPPAVAIMQIALENSGTTESDLINFAVENDISLVTGKPLSPAEIEQRKIAIEHSANTKIQFVNDMFTNKFDNTDNTALFDMFETGTPDSFMNWTSYMKMHAPQFYQDVMDGKKQYNDLPQTLHNYIYTEAAHKVVANELEESPLGSMNFYNEEDEFMEVQQALRTLDLLKKMPSDHFFFETSAKNLEGDEKVKDEYTKFFNQLQKYSGELGRDPEFLETGPVIDSAQQGIQSHYDTKASQKLNAEYKRYKELLRGFKENNGKKEFSSENFTRPHPLTTRPRWRIKDDALNVFDDPEFHRAAIEGTTGNFLDGFPHMKAAHQFLQKFKEQMLFPEGADTSVQFPRSVQESVKEAVHNYAKTRVMDIPEREFQNMEYSNKNGITPWALDEHKRTGRVPSRKEQLAHDAVEGIFGLFTSGDHADVLRANVINDEPSPFVHFDLLQGMATNQVPSAEQMIDTWSKVRLGGEDNHPIANMRNAMPMNVPGVDYGDKWKGPFMQRAAEHLQQNFLGPIINYMVREPVWMHEVYRQEKLLEPLTSRGELSEDEAQVIAQNKSLLNMIKFIHNPSNKLRVEKMISWASPFYFAKNQAWRRAFRMLGDNPGAFEQYFKTLLAVSNFVQVQEQKNKGTFLLIPGSEWISKALSAVVGQTVSNYALEAANQWAFSTTSLATVFPGVDPMAEDGQTFQPLRSVLPDAGPAVSIPIKATGFLLRPFSQAEVVDQKLAQIILGPVGASMPLWADMEPNSGLRNLTRLALWKMGLDKDPNTFSASVVSSSIYASNSMQEALQQKFYDQLISTGKTTLPSNALLWYGSVKPGAKAREKLGLENRRQPIHPEDLHFVGGKNFYLHHPEFAQEVARSMTEQWITENRADFISAVNNYTQFSWLFKTFASFGMPLSVAMQNVDVKFREGPDSVAEFIKRANGNVSKGLDNFIRAYPGKSIDVVSSTTSPTGFAWPETKEMGQWIQNNRAVVNEYPVIARYLAPPMKRGKFDPNTYLDEVSLHLRQPQTLDVHVDQIQYAMGNNWFFKVVKPIADSIRVGDGAFNYRGKTGANAAYEYEQAEIKAYGELVNPTWRKMFRAGDSQFNAETALGEFAQYLRSPMADKSSTQVQMMVAAWYDLQNVQDQVAKGATYTDAKKVWDTYIKRNLTNFPEISDALQSIFARAITKTPGPKLQLPKDVAGMFPHLKDGLPVKRNEGGQW